MFKNDEPPVSLFSFQDIITSLTGIMVFFLLLLALNLIQVHHVREKNSPERQELKQAQEKNALLREQLSAMEVDVKLYRERLKKVFSLDEKSLSIRREQLEKRRQELRDDLRQTARLRRNDEQKRARLEKENRQLKENQQRAAEIQLKNQQLKHETQEKAKQIADLRQKILKRRREVEISVDSSIRKQPLLVECSSDRILLYDVKEKSTREFPRQNSTQSEMARRMLDHLRGLSSAQFYFVFMIKPSAAGYFEDLRIRIASELPYAVCGYEPILENEGVPNE